MQAPRTDLPYANRTVIAACSQSPVGVFCRNDATAAQIANALPHSPCEVPPGPSRHIVCALFMTVSEWTGARLEPPGPATLLGNDDAEDCCCRCRDHRADRNAEACRDVRSMLGYCDRGGRCAIAGAECDLEYGPREQHL